MSPFSPSIFVQASGFPSIVTRSARKFHSGNFSPEEILRMMSVIRSFLLVLFNPDSEVKPKPPEARRNPRAAQASDTEVSSYIALRTS